MQNTRPSTGVVTLRDPERDRARQPSLIQKEVNYEASRIDRDITPSSFRNGRLSAGATLLARRPLFAQSADLPAIKPGTNTSFGLLKQVDAGVLNVGYAEAGPSDGPVAILLHGWPYDIHSYVDVAPLLASAGLKGDRPVSARLWHDALSFK